MSYVGASSIWCRMIPPRASRVWAHWPGRKFRGCRSRLHPFISVSRAPGPDSRRRVRLPVTSVTAAWMSPSASRSRPTSAASSPGLVTSSHSSGPSHSTVTSAADVTVLALSGSTQPSTAPTVRTKRGSDGRPRRLIWPGGVSSARRTRSPALGARDATAWVKRVAPPWRIRVSAMETHSLGIVEHGFGDGALDGLAAQRREDVLVHPLEAVLDEGQGDRTAQRLAVVAGRDMADHRDRRMAVGSCGKLRAFGQDFVRV